MNQSIEKFTYEHWEADEFIILYKGLIGGAMHKKDAITITNWLNDNLEDLKERLKHKK